MSVARHYKNKSGDLFAISHLKKIITGLALALSLNLGLAGCGKHEQQSDQPAAGMALPVSVVEMQPASVPISAEAVAQTEGAKEVEIRPRVGGILLKRLYEEGAPVKAGQTMFLIDPVPFRNALAQAQAQLLEQKARVVQTEREEHRLSELLETQAVSQREYDNAVSDHAIARAALQLAEVRVRDAARNLSYTSVTAPVNGIAGRFRFSEGALVEANDSLLTTLVQVSPIWVRFSLSDNELTQLGGPLTEEKVRKVTLLLPGGKEYEKEGRLNFAASQIDPQLGTQELRATFDNPDQRLLPGQFVRARVVTGTRDNVFMVPQVAVQVSDVGKTVYVVNEKSEVAVQPVVAERWAGKDWIIVDGLKTGDKVIVDNLIKVRPGMQVAPHPAEGASTHPSPAQQAGHNS